MFEMSAIFTEIRDWAIQAVFKGYLSLLVWLSGKDTVFEAKFLDFFHLIFMQSGKNQMTGN